MDEQTVAYTVRYVTVPADRIQSRLVRNPAYCTSHVQLNGWCYVPLREVRKHELQETLEKDIKEHGFRNPAIAINLPEGLFLVFGGSRLRAGQVLGLDIPLLISDHTGEFDGEPEVTPENSYTFYTDQPCFEEFGEYLYDAHNGLERMRREEWSETSTGFDWLRHKDYDRSFIERELPWAVDLLPDDTVKHSER